MFRQREPFCSSTFCTLYRQIVDHQDCLVKWLNHKIPTAILTREVEILKQLKNEHLVRFIRLESDGLGFGLVYEFMSQSLLDFLGNPQLSLNLELKKHWSVQISSGLEYLHSQEMVHRNLKPSNILLSLDLSQAKIADYGLGKLKSMSDVVIDSLYKSPELKQGRKHTCKSDIYALGLIMYELQTVKLIDDVVEPEDLESVSHLGLRKVLKQCLSPERETRPSCSDILQVLHTLPVNLKRTRQDTSLEPMRKRTLFEAVDDRDLSAVRRFLRSGVDVNQTDEDGATALYYAAESGQLHLCGQLLLRGADPNLQNRFGETPLHAAASTGNVNICHLLLESNADSLLKNKLGQTPYEVAVSNEIRDLMQESDVTLIQSDQESLDLVECDTVLKLPDETLFEVVERGDVDRVKEFVSRGADLTTTNENGLTALHVACKAGHLSVCDYLVAGSKIDIPDHQKWTPLHYAAHHGHLELCQLLVEKGASLHILCSHRMTPFLHAVFNKHDQIAHYLASAGSSVDVSMRIGYTPLKAAAEDGNLDACRLLVQCGATVTDQTNGWTPLHAAAAKGHLEICQFLVENGAPVNANHPNLLQPLHWAVKGGHTQICKLLLENNANAHRKRVGEEKPIMLAASRGDLEIVKLLVQFGAPIDIATTAGSILHAAVESGNPDLCQYLIEAGVNTEIADDRGMKPFHVAAKGGKMQVIQVFLDTGTNVNDRAEKDMTALHFAARKGDIEMCQFLIEKGGDPNIKNSSKCTPYNVASKAKHPDVARYLKTFMHPHSK